MRTDPTTAVVRGEPTVAENGPATEAVTSAPRWWGRRALQGLAAGLLLTAGLPPFGWWPLALAGAAVLALALEAASLRGRLMVAVATGSGMLGPGLFWMSEFSGPGYVVAVLIEVTLLTVALAAVPPGPGRVLGVPAAVVLAEALRGVWPFGGVPIATVAQTQIGGPLMPVARAGGGLLVAAVVAVAGVALASAVRHRVRPAAACAAVAATVVAVGFVAPGGRAIGTLDVAVVQGGGERGLLATDAGDAEVFAAHLAASEDVTAGLDLVVWPENVVTVREPVDGTPQAATMADVAEELAATVVTGVVEREGDRFRNAAVAWAPDGALTDRYEKNQRVPFGEYVPLRGLISKVADVSAIPRDAIAGSEPGLLTTPAGDLGVLISYEVFFPRRARDALVHGAEVLLVPTNASSFTTSQMPALELGAARMRAVETGRHLLQAAPTGLSGIVRPDGTVVQQSDLGDRHVLVGTVERRVGDTPYTRLGDGPFVVGAVLALAAAWLLDRRRPAASR
ncbi:MAG: apolipoprotein N-acyltransferase [Acidimicrobiales bacterium]